MDNRESKKNQVILDEHLVNIRAYGDATRLGLTDSGSRAQRRWRDRLDRLRAKREAKRKK